MSHLGLLFTFRLLSESQVEPLFSQWPTLCNSMNGPNVVTGRGEAGYGLPSRGCLGRSGQVLEFLSGLVCPLHLERDWNLWEGRPECCISITLAVSGTGSRKGGVKWGGPSRRHLEQSRWRHRAVWNGQLTGHCLFTVLAHEHPLHMALDLFTGWPAVCAPSQSAQEVVGDTQARWWAWQNMHYLIAYKVEQYCNCSSQNS